MLKSTCCSVCLSVDKRTINIYKTDLQCVYENLANFKVKAESCLLCYICCTRLQQCHLVIKQIANFQNTQTNCSQPPKSIVQLTTQNIENETIPYHVVLVKKETQELDAQERHFEHNVIVKREIDSTESTEDCNSISKLKEISGTVCRSTTKKTGKEKNKQAQTLCNVCGKTFANKYSLATHKRTHTGEKPYACEICQKSFTLANTLNIHRRTHSGEKPYSCETCKKKFNTSGYLIKHMRIHTGDKPYACETCGKRFRQKNVLTTHKRQHTGERPYQCDVCFKKFCDSSSVAKHKRTHSDVRAYTCDVCNKKFLRSYTLTEHKRIHKRTKKNVTTKIDKQVN